MYLFGTRGETRTHTKQGLNLLPLPLGYSGIILADRGGIEPHRFPYEPLSRRTPAPARRLYPAPPDYRLGMHTVMGSYSRRVPHRHRVMSRIIQILTWCGWRDSNPHSEETDSKSAAATNYATPALTLAGDQGLEPQTFWTKTSCSAN